jgi:hypothetical protein
LLPDRAPFIPVLANPQSGEVQRTIDTSARRPTHRSQFGLRQMQKIFTHPDSWSGGSVDALIYVGAANIDDANEVSRSLWSFPRLKGPYLYRDVEPDQQVPIAVPEMCDNSLQQLDGVYTHHDGSKSDFTHTTIIDDDGLWVYAGPSVGGLPKEWNVGAYPFSDGKPANWLSPLYDDLRAIVKRISQFTPLKAATYGWLTVLDCDRLIEAVAGHIPDDRWGPIDVWRDGHHSYFPATHFDAPIRLDA